MNRYTGFSPCPDCFESCGYGGWSGTANDGAEYFTPDFTCPCSSCKGTGWVECETRSFDDLMDEANEALAALDATLASITANRIGDENIGRAA